MIGVASIEMMDRSACFDHWQKVFGTEPPPRLSVEFMRMALAYEHQCKRSSGKTRNTIGRSKAALRRADGGSSKKAARALSKDAELVREWNGRTYRVQVGDDEYMYGGKTYQSLSAIAREITGTRWSGPKFFGLKG